VKLNQDFTMAVETIQFLMKRKSDDFIQAGHVAETLDFSVGYLQKVIQTLSKHGLVECKRGRIGGVRLRKRAITLLDLWNVTCGELDTVNPAVPLLKKPLKVFSDALSKVVVCKKS
jgi:DNA-binding IscR family transcriptional regulator